MKLRPWHIKEDGWDDNLEHLYLSWYGSEEDLSLRYQPIADDCQSDLDTIIENYAAQAWAELGVEDNAQLRMILDPWYWLLQDAQMLLREMPESEIKDLTLNKSELSVKVKDRRKVKAFFARSGYVWIGKRKAYVHTI